MKFRKKPVEIEAIRFDNTENSIAEIVSLVRGNKNAAAIRVEQGCVFIPTLEGLMRGEIGDWIIRGVKGECYPCKPDIFEETYEEVK